MATASRQSGMPHEATLQDYPTLLPPAERRRILSSSRLKLALTVFIALLLSTLCGIVLLMVSHIFLWLTPTMRRDLESKVLLGVREVAGSAELAMLTKDDRLLPPVFANYETDATVIAIAVSDASGTLIGQDRKANVNVGELFKGEPQKVHAGHGFFWAWTEQRVEGELVGKAAMAVSTARLEAGENLRQRLLLITLIAGLAGLGLSLSFVRFYVAPLIRVTGRAFEGLERAAHEMAAKQRLEKELEIGARIQTCLLPREVQIRNLEVAARMTPASEVGGDYYDAFAVPGGGWIGIGDVAGHGLTSGLVMLMVQSALSSLARRAPDAAPREIISQLNVVLYDNIRHRMQNREHVTLTLLRYFDDGRLLFAGAHEELLVLRAKTQAVEFVPTPGTWLGATPDISKFTVDTELKLEDGDVLVLYTDGVTEAMNAERQQFGLERLAELLKKGEDLPAADLCNLIHDEVIHFAHEREDDITLLVCRFGKS